MRRHLRASVAVVATVAAIGIVGSASAGAEVAHVFGTSFAVPDNPISVAVDESTGSVYVLTTNATAANAGKIYKFTSAGVPSNFSALGSNILVTGCTNNCRQIAVDDSGGINQGVIYVGSLGSNAAAGVRVFVPSGRPSTTIANGINEGIIVPQPFCGVAVDAAGVLFVAHSGTNSNPNFIQNEVNTYKPDQIFPDPSPAQTWPVKGVMDNVGNPNPCRLAVDSKSHMYLTPDSSTAANQFLERQILRYSVNPFVSSQPSATLFDNLSTGLAVDQSGDDVYSNHKTSIARFDSTGQLREVFGTGPLVESGGIAVNGTNGTVYAANRLANSLQVFTTVVTPDVKSASESASQTTAHLSAAVGTAGAGDIQDCEFEYGTTAIYGTKVDCVELLPYTGDRDLNIDLSGLAKETTYHWRLVLTNANGVTRSPDRTFTTHNVSGVSTDAPTDVTQTTATLRGSFVGNGEPTSYYFEWGPTAAYVNTTPTVPAGTASGVNPASAPISGLSVYLSDSSPYHYRLVASNGSGTTFGADRTFFAAPPAKPGIEDVQTVEVAQTSASVSASINPGNGPTVYWVEYGPTPAYGRATPSSESIGADESDHPVTTELSGLGAGATYHYRVVASNFGGITTSPDQVFNTPALPLITSLGSSATSETGSTLEAAINPGFSVTTYRFEFGLTRSYGSSTAESLVPVSDNTDQLVRSAIGGLIPGITYHYRVVATNAQATVESIDQTLTTVSPPVPKSTRTQRAQVVRCKKGFVKKKGKCRKKPRRHRHKTGNRGVTR